MVKSKDMGHTIEFRDGLWYYEGTNRRISKPSNVKSCKLCGRRRTKKGHDPCIKNLSGVKNACCGHGTGEGYIQFEDGTTIRGKFKVDGFRYEKKRNPKKS